MVRVSLLWVLGLMMGWANVLPIYYEDSHAGTFGFFAQKLDLEESYTLVLIDAHSDASGIPESDRIRDGLRRVLTAGERKKIIDSWRTSGVVQPFNWIEPLMPNPITRVIWIAGDRLSEERRKELEKEARVQLDWQAKVVVRECGDLAKRFEVVDWAGFKRLELAGKVVVSIDLDYFVGLRNARENLESKWKEVVGRGGLEAVSFSLSRPWQKDDVSAESLFLSAWQCGLSVQNAEIYYEPFLVDLNDRSEMAKSYLKRGELPLRFDFTKSGVEFRRMLLDSRKRIQVGHNSDRWERWLDEEKGQKRRCDVIFEKHFKGTDGIWRFSGKVKDAWVKGDGFEGYKEVKWWVYEAGDKAYNLMGGSGLGKAFTGDASGYIVWRKRLLAKTDDLALSGSVLAGEVDRWGGYGIVRLQAEVVFEGTRCFSDVVELRIRKSAGFVGGLEEQFGSPYVFGIGRMRHDGESGPETGLGNDCANFLIYSWRRQGESLKWCNPKQLRKYLEMYSGQVCQEVIRKGLLVHMGSHVAALVEDRGVKGVVDGEDLVMHHLGAYPEVIALSKIAKGAYEVMCLKKEKRMNLVAGGDVCLSRNKAETQLLRWQRDLLKKADLSLANLECCIANEVSEQQLRPKRFRYLVGEERAEELGIFDFVSLANNHSGDGGLVGCETMLNVLEKNKVGHVGVGKLKDACNVKVVTVGGIRVGVLGVNLIETEHFMATEGRLGALSYPAHKGLIEKKLRGAKVDRIVVMVHWGEEYTGMVSDEQRDVAKWLVRNGADCVVGSHSHHEQPLDYYQGKVVAYSLGNCVFEKRKAKGFNSRVMLHWNFGKRGGDASLAREK